MTTVRQTHVAGVGTLGTYRSANEGAKAKTTVQASLSSIANACDSLSLIDKAGATQKQVKTTGQKIISFLKNRLPDRVAYIGKSSYVPTRFNLSAITRSTPGDLVSREATGNIDKLSAEYRLLQSHFKHFDSQSNQSNQSNQSKELDAFGKMCEIDDTVQSCLKEARKLKGSLGAVHSGAIGLDALIEEYECFGKGLDSGRLTNFQNNRIISQANIKRIRKDIDATIKKTEKLVEIPSPGVAKFMGFSSVDEAKLRLLELHSSNLKNLEERLDTFDKHPGIHHESIGPQLQKMIDVVKKAHTDLTFDTRQQKRQEYLEQKDAKSSLKKNAPGKSASVDQKPMLAKKISPLQYTQIKRHETLEKTDFDSVSDTDSLSPPVVRST